MLCNTRLNDIRAPPMTKGAGHTGLLPTPHTTAATSHHRMGTLQLFDLFHHIQMCNGLDQVIPGGEIAQARVQLQPFPQYLFNTFTALFVCTSLYVCLCY